ncbi:MAG: T9SS type A sorting domain-containing protein [Flavobacteriales bacterium]|nr:T9SS type A sorting domain-containing protein [Flavobacteriales bacterium]
MAPILYQKCTSCHHAGGIGHFSLIQYSDAALIANAIKDAVQTKKMPPWPPDPEYSTFAYERRLTQEQINTIVQWVDGGAPQGNPALAPPPPTYTTSYAIPNPDAIAQIPHYTVNTLNDLYRCFVIPLNLGPGNLYISELEVVPGNPSIVHHVLVFADDSNQPLQMDAQDPEPGYTSFGGTGSTSSKLIGGWVPGSSAFKYPQGFGVKISGNTHIILQIHYPGGVSGEIDSTHIRLKFSSTSPTREVYINPVINHVFSLTNGPLVIQPNEIKTFYAQFTTPNYEVTNLFVAPHMHLIGKSIVCWAVTPDQDSIPVIRINNWDFHWQGFYWHKKLMRVPPQTKILAMAVYDNTSNNPNNPNNPPALVHAGEGTTDEMLLIYFGSAIYMPGDENIVIEEEHSVGEETVAFGDIIKSPQLYEPYPNPAISHLTVEGYLPQPSEATLTIRDLEGRILSQHTLNLCMGLFTQNVDVSSLATGTYSISLESMGTRRTKTFVKQ